MFVSTDISTQVEDVSQTNQLFLLKVLENQSISNTFQSQDGRDELLKNID
jgi:hypothetical protein